MSNFLFEHILLDTYVINNINFYVVETSSLLIHHTLFFFSFNFFFNYFFIFSSFFVNIPFSNFSYFYFIYLINYISNFFFISWWKQKFFFWIFFNYEYYFIFFLYNNILVYWAKVSLHFNNLYFLFFYDVNYDTFIYIFLNKFFIYQGGAVLSFILIQYNWYFELIYSFDILIISGELCFLLFFINISVNILFMQFNIFLFYDDLITFCILNNLSITEIGIFCSLFIGFFIFDIFICALDEDITDVFFYFMFLFIILLFFFLFFGIDVQYYFMISSVSSGDLTIRVILFDIINNFLCILRIFFCWVRYIFYDLQVELVDFSFHYTDSINDYSTFKLYNSFFFLGFNDFYVSYTNLEVFSIFFSTIYVYIYIYIDIFFIIFQILLSFIKLFIAFFLLWLIIDLFILKIFAYSESQYLIFLRKSK